MVASRLMRCLLLLLVGFSMLSCAALKEGSRPSGKGEATTIYVVRHAEKELGSAPGLTPQGQARAEFYAKFFAKEKFAAIYSTPTRRTFETAKPLAEAQQLPVEEYANGLEFDAFAKTLLDKHQGETIFIVGHSNTVPLLVNNLSGEDEHTDIPHEEYRRLYQLIVAPSGASTVRMWEVPVEEVDRPEK